MRPIPLFNAVLILSALVAPSIPATAAPAEALDPPVLTVGATPTLHGILDALPDDRVVFVGETHTRYDHHLVQLEVLKFLHRKYGDVALGVEWFQFPFQPVIDAYVAGDITEAQMLERTGYFDRWRFDYRLYRPILRYARDAHIPIVALNAPAELTGKIGQAGLAGLSAAERARLPGEFSPAGEAYRVRVREAFDAHPHRQQAFDHFFEVMQTWDETMARSVADHLGAHPGRRMVVLAGSGHVMYGEGIPDRVERRTGIRGTRLLVGAEHAGVPEVADYIVLSAEQALPPAARLGVMLDSADGAVVVRALSEDSALKAAGVEAGDVILAIDDTPTPDFTALKMALIDRAPGDTVRLSYRRDGWLSDARQSVEVTLGGDAPLPHR